MQAVPGWMPPLETERGLPPRCVPPGMSISGNWQRERSAALARCSQHLDTYITGNASKERKKNLKEGGIFFSFFVLLNTFPPHPAFPPSGSPDAASRGRERWKDGEAAKCRTGLEGAAPTPEAVLEVPWGSTQAGLPHPTSPWHTWLPSLALASCEMGRSSGRGDTACGAREGSGNLHPVGTAGARGRGEAGSPRPVREGSGGSGIGTRPGKSSPTWAG